MKEGERERGSEGERGGEGEGGRGGEGEMGKWGEGERGRGGEGEKHSIVRLLVMRTGVMGRAGSIKSLSHVKHALGPERARLQRKSACTGFI
jgi:hypothetical protein